MKSWVYPTPPVNGAQQLDFAAMLRNGAPSGVEMQLTLSGVGAMSPGDWTLYLARETLLDDTVVGTPADILGWTMQAGTDKGRTDMGRLTNTLSSNARSRLLSEFNRGVAIHVAAGAFDVSVRFRLQDRLQDDVLLAWVAPGRPSSTLVTGQGRTMLGVNQEPARMRVPLFAQRVTINCPQSNASLVAPALRWWAGTTVIYDVVFPVSATVQSTSTWVVPEDATHWSLTDFGGGAADNQGPILVQFEVIA